MKYSIPICDSDEYEQKTEEINHQVLRITNELREYGIRGLCKFEERCEIAGHECDPYYHWCLIFELSLWNWFKLRRWYSTRYYRIWLPQFNNDAEWLSL